MSDSVRAFKGTSPEISSGVFVADSARIIGDVAIAADANIWFGCVLRGDVGRIRVGARSNIQDLSLLHMSYGLSNTVIGDEVTVGHGVIIHGALVGDGALIGMGAILLDNCEIGAEALVAAGSLVTSGMNVPPRTLAMGRPAKVVRELREDEWQQGRFLAARYVELAAAHRNGS